MGTDRRKPCEPPGPGETLEIIDYRGLRFRLPYERWMHISRGSRHACMLHNFAAMVEAIREPDVVVADDRNADTLVYHKTVEQLEIGPGSTVEFAGFIAVVVNERDRFVVTAYPMKSVKRGRATWRKR